jgi:hypothetical protein
MHGLYAIASPELVISWMSAIMLGAAIPALAALLRSAATRRHVTAPAYGRRHARTA